MNKWIRKSVAVLVAFLTFGIITPDHEIWAELDALDQQKKLEIYNTLANDIAESYQLDELLDEAPVTLNSILEEAKKQSYIKFGEKISPIIENEFEEVIFPKMAESIEMTLASDDSLNISEIAITQRPSGDYKEKIFNIYHAGSRKDIMRFHVRVENRPQEGHYYNFHYHLYNDSFVTHYNVGEIFWSKDTPPKWLS